MNTSRQPARRWAMLPTLVMVILVPLLAAILGVLLVSPLRAEHRVASGPGCRTEEVGATSAPIVFPAGSGADTGMLRLVIDERPIITAEIDGPGHLEYNERLGDEVLGRIEALQASAAERSLAQANDALAAFGYRLASRPRANGLGATYDLYHQAGDEPLLADLEGVWPVSVNASGTNFVLPAANAFDARPLNLLVQNGEVRAWDPATSGWLPPGYVGDALAQVVTGDGVTMTYQVELEGRVVFTGTAVSMGAYMPLRSFTTWGDHWMLDVDDRLILDGQDIGQELGYDAAFGFARLGDQPFYFFEQDGLVGISFDGQVLPHLYERVFHNQCCEAAIHNVASGPDAVWFHALKDGVWYWVEASLDSASERR